MALSKYHKAKAVWLVDETPPYPLSHPASLLVSNREPLSPLKKSQMCHWVVLLHPSKHCYPSHHQSSTLWFSEPGSKGIKPLVNLMLMATSSLACTLLVVSFFWPRTPGIYEVTTFCIGTTSIGGYLWVGGYPYFEGDHARLMCNLIDGGRAQKETHGNVPIHTHQRLSSGA